MVNVRTQGYIVVLESIHTMGKGLADRSIIYTMQRKGYRGHRNPREPGAGKKNT